MRTKIPAVAVSSELLKSGHSTIARKAASATAFPSALTDFNKLPDDAYIGVRVVAALFDAGVSTIWVRTKRNELPKPKKFGPSTRWRVGDIRAVLAGSGDHAPA